MKTKTPRWYVGPRGQGQYDLNDPAQYRAWEKAWAEAYPAGVAGDATDRGSSTAPEGRGEQEPVDDSPEARAARALAQQRQAEAVAYVASYTGSWGLPLDIRADKRWGTKYLRLSDRQVEVLLDGKARDAARAAARDPKQDETVARVLAVVDQLPTRTFTAGGARVGVPDFVTSIVIQHNAGKALSERQLAALDRWAAEKEQLDARSQTSQADGLAAQPAAGAAVAGAVTEGLYTVGDVVWKVQHTRENHARLYAKRLVLSDQAAVREPGDRVAAGRWDYVPGGLTIVQKDGVRMTLEQAEAFGQLYGICAVCGAELTDEKSIARGIGPVCASRV